MMDDKYTRWGKHFIKIAATHAEMSKDPEHKVGAIIVGSDREILSTGFNGFPRHIKDSLERLNDREMKLKIIVHAELNAILAAARHGIRIKGCSMYITRAPCTRCAVQIIQAGIDVVIAPPFKDMQSRWLEDIRFANFLLEEANVSYLEIDI